MTQKAIVLKVNGETALVRIKKSGVEKDVKITNPVKEMQTVDIFQNLIV